jgi:uncharacterized sulfatase
MTKVVIICADDLGREQFQSYGIGGITGPLGVAYPDLSEIEALKTNGVRLTNFYVHAFCSPTRASEITGLWPGNSGVGNIIENNNTAPLVESNLCLPELLGRLNPGIRRATIGKLHLSNQQNGDTDAYRRMGFEFWNGSLRNLPIVTNSYTTYSYYVNGELRRAYDYWATRKTTDDAIRYLRKYANDDVYLRVCYNAPHEPFQRPPAGTYDSVTWVCPDEYPVNQTVTATIRPYFKAMCENLSYEIGRLLAEIDFGDTLVFFFADNGTATIPVAGEYNGVSGAYWDGRTKRTVYDGGIRIPAFARGYGINNTNRDITQLVSVVDLFPTILDLFGLSLPETARIDGQSFTHLLEDAPGTDRQYLLSEIFGPENGPNAGTTDGRRAVRSATHKLIWIDEAIADGPSEFYNLNSDPMELTNLLPGPLSPTDLAEYNAMINWLSTQWWASQAGQT